jgi:hypothetical protein
MCVVGDSLLRGRRATIAKLTTRASVVEVLRCVLDRAR